MSLASTQIVIDATPADLGRIYVGAVLNIIGLTLDDQFAAAFVERHSLRGLTSPVADMQEPELRDFVTELLTLFDTALTNIAQCQDHCDTAAAHDMSTKCPST